MKKPSEITQQHLLKPGLGIVILEKGFFFFRFSKGNMMLWGLWQGKGKPSFNTFFEPFTSEMSKLYNEGKCCNVNNYLILFNLSSVSSITIFPFQVKHTALILFQESVCHLVNLAYQLKVNIHFHA